MPNFKGTRFTNAHETLIWAARDKRGRPRFNYAAMKAFNDDIQMRSDWVIPICSGPERLRGADGKKLHPTQKPEALIARCLLATSRPGDVVLDPFFGTGTVGAVAKRLGRQWIGIERDAAYADAAEARIAAVEPLDASALVTTCDKRAAPRVPFGSILDLGLLRPGDVLFDDRGTTQALVRADGSLATRDATGSIHQLGARIQGRTSCNGWTYWHYRTGNSLQPIDRLRDEARVALGLGAE